MCCIILSITIRIGRGIGEIGHEHASHIPCSGPQSYVTQAAVLILRTSERTMKLHTAGKHIATALTIFIASLTGLTAFAQVPNIGDAIKQATPPPDETRTAPTKPEASVIVEEGGKPFAMPEGETIFVREFKIEGAAPGDEVRLQSLLAPHRNKDLAMAEITQAANKITIFYRDRGYLLAKAYVPKQDARGGVLTIRVILGSYGKISLKNDSLIRESIVQAFFDKVKEDSRAVTRDGLERAMLLIRDTPGAKIPTVTISPGEKAGTSDFQVEVDRSQRLSSYIMADNQGSKFTGKNRLYAGIDVNSPFAIGDKFSVAAMRTNDNDGLQNVRLAYGFPLSFDGLRAEIAASRTKYTLGGVYSTLDAVGKADILEATLFYPLRKTRDETMDLSLNFAYKKVKDDQDAVGAENPRDIAVGTLALQSGRFATLFGRNFSTSVSAGASLGTLKIRDDDQKLVNDYGANTSGTFSKVNFLLSGNLDLTEKFSVRATARAQKVLTAHNLDPVEQFFINGITGVRAYTESVSFDNGYVVSAEVRYALPEFRGVRHSLGLFADTGLARPQKGDYIADSKYTTDRFVLSDVGLGYYLNAWKFFGTIQVVWPIGNTNPGVADPGTRILTQVGASF